MGRPGPTLSKYQGKFNILMLTVAIGSKTVSMSYDDDEVCEIAGKISGITGMGWWASKLADEIVKEYPQWKEQLEDIKTKISDKLKELVGGDDDDSDSDSDGDEEKNAKSISGYIDQDQVLENPSRKRTGWQNLVRCFGPVGI